MNKNIECEILLNEILDNSDKLYELNLFQLEDLNNYLLEDNLKKYINLLQNNEKNSGDILYE